MIDDLPEPLRSIVADFSNDIDGLMNALANGTLTVDAWLAEFGTTIARYHVAGLMAGQGSDNLDMETVNLLGSLVAVQLAFAQNFASVIRASLPELTEKLAGFVARARQYAFAVKVAFKYGDMIRRYGRVLPFPAMPAQGTQCGNNCGCDWRVATLDEGAGDYDCYWVRHKDDSCQTCHQREQDWSPVRIRGGVLLP